MTFSLYRRATALVTAARATIRALRTVANAPRKVATIHLARWLTVVASVYSKLSVVFDLFNHGLDKLASEKAFVFSRRKYARVFQQWGQLGSYVTHEIGMLKL